ncbi:MAG: hypothetical protein D6714_02105 [Bacteroidetes bacterium]|nr:MAG: hypothetical protein D6714_02105 [Bacteroidota bacterium]
MKKLFLGSLVAIVALLTACQPEDLIPVDTTIVQGNGGTNTGSFDPNGGNKCMKGDTISADSLPQAALDYVAENYADQTIETAVAGFHHFSVELSDGTVLIFDETGTFHKICGGGGNPGGGHPHGGPCMKGDSLGVSDLPASVQDYVSANYADATIEAAVTLKDGYLGVELSDGTVLIFDETGAFVKECGKGGGHPGGGHPGGGHGGNVIAPSDLPAVITDYISANHADATIEKAFVKDNGNYFVRLSDHTKLVFDADGNVLFDSGN